MKQAGWCWLIFLLEILTRIGFTTMEVNQSLYIFHSGATTVAIWIHVDNGVIASNSQLAVSDFKWQICAEMEIKWHDTISQVLGLECAVGEGEGTIAQKWLTSGILDTYPQAIIKTDSPLPVLSANTSNLKDTIPFGHWLSR
ncbi:hypothetical protein O181_077949 [Austropuccinia psidii MF-1]|uniref:Reverse transcriptase Ty1/copia-type domain-containing protein n=1 Tax=Austropuccinia psidii MF-1 TaxID=1389203 RepID=A0A9Q3FFY5_9BASI|nr:hypothetical protein [Austropuccinia psidii MF-1]